MVHLEKLLHPLIGGVDSVQISSRVAVDIMAVLEGAPTGQQLSIQSEDAQPGHLVGDIYGLACVDVNTHGRFEIGPLVQKGAVVSEDLNSVVFSVAYVDSAVFRDSYTVGHTELAWAATGRSE